MGTVQDSLVRFSVSNDYVRRPSEEIEYQNYPLMLTDLK